jgi:putative flippase GtrA
VQALWARYGNSLRQFLKFGLIGGAGAVVNQVVVIVCNVLGRDLFGVGYDSPLVNLFGSAFHLRYLQLYAVIAFLVANMFNFILNRYWTFRGHARAPFFKEYAPFLLVGSVAALVGVVLLTWLTKSDWPLSFSYFDDSTGLRNRLYWANLIQIVLVMPVNFVLNKVWTFQAVRRRHAASVERKAAAASEESE